MHVISPLPSSKKIELALFTPVISDIKRHVKKNQARKKQKESGPLLSFYVESIAQKEKN